MLHKLVVLFHTHMSMHVYNNNYILLLLLFCFTVSSTEGLTATCAAAFGLHKKFQLE